MNIGIFGGTFNPPHMGHLIVAESVREQLHLDKILFIPSARPPHKSRNSIVAATHRVEMTRRAIAENPYFELSEIEIRRKGKSYTIDTLEQLKTLYPQDELFLIIGADELIDFHTWRYPDKILQFCQVVVINRPGFDISQVANDIIRKVVFAEVPNIEISSTEIREKVRLGKSIRYLVPAQIEQYILQSKIYSR